jgi:hypothetical protein
VASRALVAPAREALPAGRLFSDELLALRSDALEWTGRFYDGEHLARTGDWLLALDPGAPEPLVIAALLHDIERSIPGGPVIDMRRDHWDDPAYNRAHCYRSAAVVAGWLVGKGASPHFVEGVLPIREHELGGAPEGDLLQAADSLSWLEVNGRLAREWVERGRCDVDKAREKLLWMCDRVRLVGARGTAGDLLEAALAELGW